MNRHNVRELLVKSSLSSADSLSNKTQKKEMTPFALVTVTHQGKSRMGEQSNKTS